MSRRDGNPVLVTPSGAMPLLQRRLGAVARPDALLLDESALQSLLDEHPQLLPLEQIEGSFETLYSVCREFQTKHGPIDNVFMTAEGDIVIAEVKLWRNPEARRKVVPRPTIS